ncbi:MAG: FdhF/YdeP family oxidoreductase [Candidatus Thermoplasmatota archaeon]|nr:FdhF/YdeP family oxidoreductase [Candidatus Thermoplasmatota archaeon]
MRKNVSSQPPIEKENLKIRKPKNVAAGIPGVTKSFRIGIAEAGLSRTIRTMRTVNKFDGFDCPGCAWPDPDNHRSGFEFCENGAKAFATEATKKRLSPELLSSKTVQEWSLHSDMELDKLGRLTHPMILRKDSDRYEPLSWDDAFSVIAKSVDNLDSPDECVLYTSGRASNEAAFLWGTLARQIGTNNLPDCSNMCHESSGVGLTESIGIGKGTVRLDCFDTADMVLVIGQNPGTNHPRMLSALAKTKRNGGSVISINPLMETGLNRFKHPQEIIRLLGRGTPIADDHFPVRIGGDQALLQGIAKVILQEGELDWGFIDEHTEGFEDWKTHISNTSWDEIVSQSGIEQIRIESLGKAVSKSERLIICWAMGITQHENAVATIQEACNILLAGGHFGKPGAGACPVRGHSNVQGDRTVGINHHPSTSFLDACERETGINMPRKSGFDSVEFVRAARDKKVRLFMALGGNILSAMSDTEEVARAMHEIDLTVQISTKLNRSHLVTGHEALILPCLGRTEIDPAGFVTVENSMGVVHSSTGKIPPASSELRSESAIICGVGSVCFGENPFDWSLYASNHDSTRDLIESVLPGFSNYNERVREKGGFYLPNGPRDGPTWNTPNGKAIIHSHSLLDRIIPENRFILMTMRSHDQYNTTIYGMDDRYRGVYNSRRIIFMNQEDMDSRGLSKMDLVDLTSHFEGREKTSEKWKIVPYEIPRGNLAAYFPEANVLVPLDSVAKGSNTPTSKWVEVSLKPHKD